MTQLYSEFEKHSCKLSDILLINNNYTLKDLDDYNVYYEKNNLNKNDPYWGNRTRFYDCFKYINTNIDNNEVSIIHPTTKDIVKSDFYFMVTGPENVLGNNLYCCYYFKSSNIILFYDLGTGLGSMNTNTYILIDFDLKNMYYTYDLILSEDIFNKILIKKTEIEGLDDYEMYLKTIPYENTTFYGFHNNIGHHIFNDYTGIHLLKKSNVFNKTNNFVIGLNNTLNFYEYFEKYFPDKKIIKCDDIKKYDNFSGRGIVYKYNHHFVSEDMREYLYNNILNNDLINVSKETELMLSNIKKQNIKLLIVLRCGSRDMIDQETTIIEFIKLFKHNYPDAAIILSGFISNNLSNSDLKVGYFNQKYIDIKDQYNIMSKNIIDKSNVTEIYNIIDLNFKETFLISKECTFGIYQHGSASTIPAWLCNIPGISIGFHDMKRYIYIDKHINQNNVMYYLEDSNIINFDVNSDADYKFKIHNIPFFYEYFESLIQKYI